MHRFSRVLSAAALGCAVALSGATAFAQEPTPDATPREGKFMKRHGRGHGGFGMRHAEALNLTDAQKQQMQEIRRAEGEAMRTLHDSLAEKRRALEAALAAEQVNRATVDSLVQEIGAAQTELLRRQTELRLKMHEVLTPEQREQMRTQREQMRQRRDGMRDRMRERRQGQGTNSTVL